jgi:putative Holliday junction resolvase
MQFRVERRGDVLATVRRLVAEQGAGGVVVGLPLHADGTAGEQARWTRDVAAALAETLDVPVETWDERFSTDEADAILDRAGGPVRDRQARRDRKARRDMVAAAVILQDYLDSQAGQASSRGGPEPRT